MSVKHALLGLLAQRPMHGYELKTVFEETVGTLWDLNIGQVYNTLRILERDGSVELLGLEQEGRGPERKIYAVTNTGREELKRWLSEPVRQPRRLKDAFYIKLVIYHLLELADLDALIWQQRQAYLQALHQIHNLRARTDPRTDPFTALILDGGLYHVEADLRWLERCEELLTRLENKTK